MIAPWMLKNWIILRIRSLRSATRSSATPIFILSLKLEYAHSMRDYDVTDKRTLPLEVTIRGEKTQGLLGLTFLAAPLALFALRFRQGRRLLAVGLLLGLPYYFNIGTRFLIPALPFVSLSMALAMGSTPWLLATLMIFHAFTSYPSEIHRYSASYVWKLDHILIAEALRLVPQDKYLRQKSAEYSAARMVEAAVPKGERILGTQSVPLAYCNRDFLVGYQGALNQTMIDTMNIGWVQDYQPTRIGIIQVSYAERSPDTRASDRLIRQSRCSMERSRNALLP